MNLTVRLTCVIYCFVELFSCTWLKILYCQRHQPGQVHIQRVFLIRSQQNVKLWVEIEPVAPRSFNRSAGRRSSSWFQRRREQTEWPWRHVMPSLWLRCGSGRQDKRVNLLSHCFCQSIQTTARNKRVYIKHSSSWYRAAPWGQLEQQ